MWIVTAFVGCGTKTYAVMSVRTIIKLIILIITIIYTILWFMVRNMYITRSENGMNCSVFCLYYWWLLLQLPEEKTLVTHAIPCIHLDYVLENFKSNSPPFDDGVVLLL